VRRTIFTDEHEQFRHMVRAFLEKECVPHTAEWLEAGVVSREAWRKAGELGLLGWMVAEEYGGLGIRDFRYSVVIAEEIAATGTQGIALALHNDVVAPYLTDLTTPEQRRRWLPGFVTGERLVAIAMSESGAGSDLKQVKATARRNGDTWILNGTKTFISNGILADLVIVVARTEPEAGHKGMSLLVVEEGFEGFERGRKLDKIGNRAQDTAELFFRDVRVPATHLLGEPGQGFYHLMRNLPQERLGIAVYAIAHADRAFAVTREYAQDRHAFGRPIGGFQVNRFALAEMKTKLDVAHAYLDRCVQAAIDGELTADEAAGAKWWATELQWEIVDRCLQLHGGYGYINEYEIARLWRDARVQRLYGGTTEIMKEIVGRGLGFLQGGLAMPASTVTSHCPHWCSRDHSADTCGTAFYHASDTTSVACLDVQTAQYLPDDPGEPAWSPTVEIAVHAGGRYRLIGLTPEEARELAEMLARAAQLVSASSPGDRASG
jgi:alkylation response protein AidB-like acyl-CoA dehydrogenase